MKRFDSKLIVLDLDGTLLRNDKTVSKENIDALLNFKAKGNKILFATARPPRDAYKYVPVPLRDNPIICYNGACIINKDKEIIYSKQIERKDVINTLYVFKKHGYNNLCLEIDDRLYSNFDTTDYFGAAPTTIVNLEELHFEKAYKVLVCSRDPVIFKDILGELPKNVKGIITDFGSLCQVMNSQVNKWTSIKVFLDEFGINKEDSIAFGDDHNDIEMLKNCGIGVAMKNAEDAVKEIADVVTSSNVDDGIAKYINNNLI